ncbi:MAG: TrkA C-terminal domain-containing protein, partial [Bacteroidales bacterium]
LTELMHVKPMDQLLYDFMIQHLPDDYPKRMTISVDVSPGSYLDGKTPATLTLPERCIIVAIYRGPEAYRFVDGFSLEAGDLVDIEIDSDDLEKIYQPLVSMAFG